MASDQWVDINSQQWVDNNDVQWQPSTNSANLGATIVAHQPVDLNAMIETHSPKDLLAYIHGLDYRNLPASISVIQSENLPASVGVHSPKDLGAYLRVQPMKGLPARIHGWQTSDLQALIRAVYKENLPAAIQAHLPRNIRGTIKGWVREATSDLPASVHSFTTEDLGGIIRSTYLEDLPGFLYPIQPVDLPAYIRGWATRDLQGIINGVLYPWDLPAYINGSPWRSDDLPAKIISSLPGPQKDLTAYILTTKGRSNLTAAMNIIQSANLSASIDTGRDIYNLPASIYPKVMRLTAVVSMITMEHRDLSATISIPCFYSNYKDLPTYIRPVLKGDLGATIYPQGWLGGISNLGAKWGYADKSVVQDKLKINFTFTGWDYRTEDKIRITASIFRSGLNLGASIVAYRPPADLPAYINGVDIPPYDFDVWKLREKVYSRNYTQAAIDYEDVDISFKTIVRDYFYSSGSNVVAKVDKYEHFLTKVASYYSPAKARTLNERLHKIKYLYDLRKFSSIDEAIKFAILYVTEQPERDLQAYINATGNYFNLTSSIVGKDKISTNQNLTSSVTGEKLHTYNVVVGFTDDGVGYLQF